MRHLLTLVLFAVACAERQEQPTVMPKALPAEPPSTLADRLPRWPQPPPCKKLDLGFPAEINACLEQVCETEGRSSPPFKVDAVSDDFRAHLGCYELDGFDAQGGLRVPPSRIRLTDRWDRGTSPYLTVEAVPAHAFSLWWLATDDHLAMHFGDGFEGTRLCFVDAGAGVLTGYAIQHDDTGPKRGTLSAVSYRTVACPQQWRPLLD